MEDELREKIAYEIANNCFPAPPFEHKWAYKIADKILSLIDGERCGWTTGNEGGYRTSCGAWYDLHHTLDPRCPECGKRIEVKEVKDGQG